MCVSVRSGVTVDNRANFLRATTSKRSSSKSVAPYAEHPV